MLNIQCIRYGSGEHYYSSNDKWLYFELDDDAFNEIATEEELQNVQNIDGKLVRCLLDFKHYAISYARDVKKTDDTTQEYLESMFSKHYKATLAQEQSTRKDKGYINGVKDYDKMKPEDYYGLLEKYLTKETLKYLDGGVVFGYIWHEERTKESQKVISEFLYEKTDKKEKVKIVLLRNGTGRHFMDNCPSPEELRKFLEEL